MRHCLLPILLLLFSSAFSYALPTTLQFGTLNNSSILNDQNQRDRKLSSEEVQRRGIDEMVNRVMANIRGINFKAMARSDIFETSYGFRWKMFNLHTGQIIAIRVNKNFKLLKIIK
ncbi:hypothetical protein ACE939_08260 [Aquimarina sp. W85]|uniref:hypothetical protein n=1 Tax=Aquimarina rhodophyticola TaxID=3342246 RepID=UPI0036733A38